MTTPVVAVLITAALACAWVAVGLASRYLATHPATCGAAIDVPLNTASAVSEVCPADAMATPGANTSTQVPKLEKEARRSSSWVAATTMPLVERGLLVEASVLKLLAMVTANTP